MLLASRQELHVEERGKSMQAQSDLRAFGILLEIYKKARGRYPDDLRELSAFVASRGVPPGRLLVDPWGTPYWYQRNESGLPSVRSVGPNKKDEHGGGDDVTVPQN